MENSIQVFNSNDFGSIRALNIDNEPWFVAKDVCNALGVATNHLREKGRGLDDDEVMNLPNWEGKGAAPLIISEAGLYSLILRSRKPEARKFKRWVTHEVIPSIRKDGGYIAAWQDESDAEIMARALLVAQRTIERKTARIAELEPKALFADAVAASDGTCLIGELAKMLRQNGVNIGQNRLFELLRNEGYLGKTGQNRNVPTQRAMELGLFRIKETAITHSDGHVTISRTPKVTGKGQRYFVERYCHGRKE